MPETQTLSTAMTPQERTPIAQLLWQGGTVLALIVLIVFFTIVRPDVFPSFTNVRNIFEQVAILTIIAAAQTLVMVVGDFDLSVGTNATLSGAIATALMIGGTPVPLAILVALAAGALVGAVNGVLVAYVKLSAFVATLATMTTVGGLAYIVTNGTTLYGMPEEFFWIGQGRVLGMPMPVVFALLIAALVWVVLRFTTFGRRLYAVGGNAEVARLSGVNVRRARLLAFTFAGLGSAVGGIVLVSRLGSASSASANNYMLLAIAAVFLGMTILKSGQANLGGTLVGVGIIGVLSNGLNILGVNTYVQQVLTGLIIIAAVTLSALKARDA
ncbi:MULTISPECIES: ABC transporter permease [Microbacterium]|jgi:ribose transport system permease protein|uniref:ABC transporter permease n=1 Tax=Microbacterium TaxID=33882 RepID=UPI0023DAA985|nr:MULTISPECIES: ABC transporter permease [Microbacterium]MDF2048151.1 ABC transporter permease [Microbacterium sp. Kw_RZR3]MDF2916433.1 transporter permease [Microbacterium sp.]MDQ1075509.1 ribose transport system permease protein [Microbacterium sp. SORGH_AS_0969]MDQ1115747.1 ribose transport system permease protein [Microbacterium testaceum]